ncbi:hypothetical protein, partial [Thiolapillus sp.]|uniref:hypothetical protein n=1 Tax=Thiolapillus sp. TaxID=2017437 RepID=UPI003AF5E3BE
MFCGYQQSRIEINTSYTGDKQKYLIRINKKIPKFDKSQGVDLSPHCSQTPAESATARPKSLKVHAASFITPL